MMDIIERLEELMNLELFDADEQIPLTADVAARIVAAEIIANAIKEAAPRKSGAAYNITVGNPQSFENPERLAGELRKLLEESERILQNPTQ